MDFTKPIYKKINVPDHLHTYFASFWSMENLSDETLQYTIFPDGYFDVVIFSQNKIITNIFLYGIWSKQADVFLLPKSTVTGISCRPLAAECVFNRSVSEAYNSFIELKASDLYFGKTEIAQHEGFIDGFIQNISLSKGNCSFKKQKLFNLISHGSCPGSVEEIAFQLNWGTRQINRYFNSYFGLSLKSYLNIVKCSALYNEIGKGNLYPEGNYF